MNGSTSNSSVINTLLEEIATQLHSIATDNSEIIIKQNPDLLEAIKEITD